MPSKPAANLGKSRFPKRISRSNFLEGGGCWLDGHVSSVHTGYRAYSRVYGLKTLAALVRLQLHRSGLVRSRRFSA